MGDRPLPDRRDRQRRGSDSQPVFRGRPACPLLAAGSDLQPSAPLLCRSSEQPTAGSARAQRFIDVAKRGAFWVRGPDGNAVAELERVPHADALGRRNTDAHAHIRADAVAYANPHIYADADAHADADSDANTNTDAYPHTHTHTHTHTYAHAHADTDTDTYAHPNTDTYAYPDTHTHTYADACLCHHERL